MQARSLYKRAEEHYNNKEDEKAKQCRADAWNIIKRYHKEEILSEIATRFKKGAQVTKAKALKNISGVRLDKNTLRETMAPTAHHDSRDYYRDGEVLTPDEDTRRDERRRLDSAPQPISNDNTSRQTCNHNDVDARPKVTHMDETKYIPGHRRQQIEHDSGCHDDHHYEIEADVDARPDERHSSDNKRQAGGSNERIRQRDSHDDDDINGRRPHHDHTEARRTNADAEQF